MLSTIVVLAASATLALSQATPQQVAVVEAEYNASELDAAYPNGFGIPLKAEATLAVVYGSTTISLGQPYAADAVATLPTITVTPVTGSAGTFNTSAEFTVMLADANPLGNAPAQAQGQYRHYLSNGAKFGTQDATTGAATLTSGSGTVVAAYAGPGPAAGEGPHRYAWLVFEQPSTFNAPANLSAAGVGPGHWFVNQYVTSSNLGPLVAASFFTVENGQASYSEVATSSVNTATVSGAGPTSAGSASSGRPSASGSGSSARPSASGGASGSSSGAGTVAASGLLAVVGAAFAMVFA